MLDYETTWYCLRRADGETFPDGIKTTAKLRKARRPIWIKLGEGFSWCNAITFGCNRYEVEKAARDFGAKEIVWLEPEPELSKQVKQYHRWIHGDI